MEESFTLSLPTDCPLRFSWEKCLAESKWLTSASGQEQNNNPCALKISSSLHITRLFLYKFMWAKG